MPERFTVCCGAFSVIERLPNAFRVGDTKFELTANNTAVVKNVVTDSASGQTYLDQAYAKRS